MHHLKTLIQHPGLILLGLFLFIDNSLAALPTPVAPSTGAPNGNWLDLMKGYIKDGGLVIGLLIAIAVFLLISWILMSKFNEARAGKADWGEVGLVGVVGVAVMIFVSYLLTEASTVI